MKGVPFHLLVRVLIWYPPDIIWTNWHLPTRHGHLPSTSTRTSPGVAAAADLGHPLEGVHGADQEGL